MIYENLTFSDFYERIKNDDLFKKGFNGYKLPNKESFYHFYFSKSIEYFLKYYYLPSSCHIDCYLYNDRKDCEDDICLSLSVKDNYNNISLTITFPDATNKIDDFLLKQITVKYG